MNLPITKKLGILGGGQLGKMLIEASRPWNLQCIVLENDEHCPASLVADRVIKGSLYDADRISELADATDILTYEIEHVNVNALLELTRKGKKIFPQPEILELIQDKGKQKQFFVSKSIPTAPFCIVSKGESFDEALELISGERVVLKQRTGGYDGKGVEIISREVIKGKISNSDCLIEAFYESMTEYAVIVARAEDGSVKTYPLIEMYFHPISNLVEYLFSPADIDSTIEDKCHEIAIKTIEEFNGIGVFAVELFVVKGTNEVLINEIAPRPHNSGHHTIEGCYTSQFEQLNRILLGLPLGDTSLIQPSAMINLVGPDNFSGNYELNGTDEILKLGGVYIHLYNKREIRPNRKMGHITIMAPTIKEMKKKAGIVKELIRFVPKK